MPNKFLTEWSVEPHQLPPDFDTTDFRPALDEKRPDWRNKRAYPAVKTTMPREWAWNFWCRNPDVLMNWAEGRGSVDPTGPMPDGWFVPAEQKPIYVDLKIDITRPLDAEFKAARKSVERHPYVKAKNSAAAGSKLRPSNYVMYLRVMDAHSSGAKIDDVVMVLSRDYPGLTIDDIARLLKAGKEMAWSGYTRIAFRDAG